MNDIVEQWEEFECVASMFPAVDELVRDDDLIRLYEEYVSRSSAAGPAPSARLEYTIRFTGEVPALSITCPPQYPSCCRVRFVVHCATLSRTRMEQLNRALENVLASHDGELVVLSLYQCMADLLADGDVPAIANRDGTADLQSWGSKSATCEAPLQSRDLTSAAPTATPTPTPMVPPTTTVVLGRRAIYFHHIIANNKRRVVKQWAQELSLGGLSKIGWPGVVIVEGDELDVQEYVKRLQHLRWKQMVVRGEQSEQGVDGQSLRQLRRFPCGGGPPLFIEFPEDGMSAAAAMCRDAGLESLFLSVMKIYRDDADSVPSQDDSTKGSSKTSSIPTRSKRASTKR